MPPQITLPPRFVFFRAKGTNSPAGANRIAASSGSGGASVESPAQCAPQLIAKMSLKTNPKMPVHGADGVHVRYSKADKRLLLYWGESKVHADVGAAISAGFKAAMAT